jgi:branched-chain amino acid transport system ATP-binding protein
MTLLLDVKGLDVRYGQVRAVRGVDLTVEEGQTIAVIGANGVGKSSLLRAISNMIPTLAGTVQFCGKTTKGARPDTLFRDGLMHLPEGRGTLPKLTVRENLQIVHEMRRCDEPFATALLRAVTRFPRLEERLSFPAGFLSGGEQQMLALARAIVAPPKLLLVDEPSLGLSPVMIKEAFAVLAQFKKEGIPLIVVEQNARAALALADVGYVMRQGKFVMSGKASDILADKNMLAHYLGT